MASPVESEIKLRMADPTAARAAVLAIAAHRTRERHFEDNLMFDDAGSSLAARGQALRLRRTDDRGGVLTLKGPRQDREGVKRRSERETAVADADAMQSILEGLRFRALFRYQKYREVYRWRDAEIMLDETPVGTFVEIEGPLPTIHAAASALGYGPQDYIRDSYAALFLAGGGKGDMVFP